MAKTIEIRPLAKDDDRRGFSCGQPDLNRFFEHYAGQNQFKLHLAVTYVVLVEPRIVGFATVAASSIERASVPSVRLRKRLPAYPLPVLRLARLGIDTRARGLGLGKVLLRHVLGLAVEQRDRIGCVGVVTDAKRREFPGPSHGPVPSHVRQTPPARAMGGASLLARRRGCES